MSSSRNLAFSLLISARDNASSVLSGLRAHAGKVASAIAGYFGYKLFGQAVDSAREFETAMSAVRAASGASAEEFAALSAAAEQAGASTKYTSAEAANALENLAKAGLSAADAVQTLPAVLNLAQAGGVGLATASEYVTKAVAGMGLSFAEAGRVADVLAMGANASNTSVEGLADALSYAAPLANSLGLSLEQTVAIIGKFADAGIDASRAGTALNSILAQFSDPASKFREALAGAGITTGNFDTALRQLAAAGPAGQKAILAVGQEAGPALRALLNQGIDSLDALKAKLDQSAGSAATFAKVMGDNLDGATKGFGSAWDALLIKIGTPVLETLKGQINAIADRLREFVTNGTAGQFGLAIKSAFESGGKWAADFFSKIDFTQLATDLQSFASRAGEVFDWIGQKASLAGNTAQLAYGVMSAGISTVLTAVYSLGRGMSWLTSAFLADLASIAQGIAKVTFGDLSRGFAEAAAKLRFEAQAAYAVSEEFGRKSGEAFAGIVVGSEAAAAGWKGLTTESTVSAKTIATDLQTVQEQITLTADQLDAIGEGGQFIGGVVTQVGKAAKAASAAMQEVTAGTAEQVKGAEALRDALRTAWQGAIDGARKAREEAAALFAQAADARVSGADKAAERRNRGLSDEERNTIAARDARAARDAASSAVARAVIKAYEGDLKGAEKMAAEAAKQAERAERFASLITDDNTAANLFEELGNIRAQAIEAQARIKQQEAKAGEQQADALQQQIIAAEERLLALKGELAKPVPIALDISAAEGKIKQLQDQLATLGGATGGSAGQASQAQVRRVDNATAATAGSADTTATVTADTTQAQPALDAVRTAVEDIPDRKTVVIDAIIKDWTSPTSDAASAWNASQPGFAGGGHIRGPGTATSDSILARLSDGEYVVRAAAVRRYGLNFLHALNGMSLPKFATGGLVASAMAPALAETGSNRALVGRDIVLPNGERFRAYTESDQEAQISSIMQRLALQMGRRG